MATITTDGAVWTLNLGDDENRFTPAFLDEVESGLDKLEASDEPAVLVTIGTGKFFSNGLDLQSLGLQFEGRGSYVERVQALFARFLTLPVPTVAAVNGHAFGAGAMLAMSHDFRVMRDDRGFLCFPEVDIKIPFTTGMSALITARLTPQAAVTAMTTGRRYGGVDAARDGLVDATASADELHSAAAEIVRPLAGKDRGTLDAIKNTLFAPAVDALRAPIG